MPQRTNDFQKLVALIHRALGPKGAKIDESVMVESSTPGDFREVDVVMETDVSPYRVKVAIEVKDEKRSFSMQDLEAYYAKYRGPGGLLSFDKVVIVTRSGFTKKVRKRAVLLGISLLTVTDAENNLVEAIKQRPAITRSGPFLLSSEVELVNFSGSKSEAIKHGRLVCRHGTDFGSVHQYLHKHVMPKLMNRDDFREAAKKHAGAVCIKGRTKMEHYVMSLFGKNYEIREIRFHVHASQKTGTVQNRTYQIKGDGICKTVEYVEMDFGTGHEKIGILFPEGIKSEKAALSLSGFKLPLSPRPQS